MTMKCMMCGKQKPEDQMLRDSVGHITPMCQDCMGEMKKAGEEMPKQKGT